MANESKHKKDYIAWLNDAHAMELALVTMLEKQIKETEGKPDMRAKLEEHLEQTKRHAQLVEDCVERNGGSTSALKDIFGKTGAAVQGMGLSMMSDAMVKNVHGSYAAEHFEIATYTLLHAAAVEMGDDKTAEVRNDILQDEMEMADWLLEQLPHIAKEHLRHAAA